MSGGSWDYSFIRMEENALRLKSDEDPLRRAFGNKLLLFAKAMKNIEWVDSCDYGEGDDVEAIKAALGNNVEELVMAELIIDAQALIEQFKKYGVK